VRVAGVSCCNRTSALGLSIVVLSLACILDIVHVFRVSSSYNQSLPSSLLGFASPLARVSSKPDHSYWIGIPLLAKLSFLISHTDVNRGRQVHGRKDSGRQTDRPIHSLCWRLVITGTERNTRFCPPAHLSCPFAFACSVCLRVSDEGDIRVPLHSRSSRGNGPSTSAYHTSVLIWRYHVHACAVLCIV
jgi:hypothetical protein